MTEINFDKMLSKKNFEKFIEEDTLLMSKSKIAQYFGVSQPTLRKWMRNNGYERFIGVLRGRAPNKPKSKIEEATALPDDFFKDLDLEQ